MRARIQTALVEHSLGLGEVRNQTDSTMGRRMKEGWGKADVRERGSVGERVTRKEDVKEVGRAVDE